jgi:hypothetical protein
MSQTAEQRQQPYICARYQDSSVIMAIESGEMIIGDLPTKQTRLVLAWIEIHKENLMANWQLLSNGQLPITLNPLQ